MLAEIESHPGFLHYYRLGDMGAIWLHMCIRHQETGSYLMDVANPQISPSH